MKVLFLLFLLSCLSLHAQRVSVSQIFEGRSTSVDNNYNNRTELTLNITGDEVRRHKFIRIAAITSAVDDQGFNLIGEASSTEFTKLESNGASVVIYLQNASRKAETIKEIQGNIEFFSPTVENGGIIREPSFAKGTNKDLLPKMTDIQVAYITKESYDKIVNDQKDVREEELKKQPKEVQELANALGGLVDLLAYNDWSYPQVNLLITGNSDKLISIDIEKPDGTVLSNNGYTYYGDVKTYYFEEEILPTYTLIMHVKSDKAIKSIPFTIKEVLLP